MGKFFPVYLPRANSARVEALPVFRCHLFNPFETLAKVVILVKTGIQFLGQTRDLLDSRLRGNDGH
jgi:hypothetical protein